MHSAYFRNLLPHGFRGWNLLFLVLATGLGPSAAHAQARFTFKTPQASKPNALPLSHLYMHFLLYQNHLDKSATLREAQGRDGAWLRNHFQDRLGFTSSQFSIVRAAGLKLESDLSSIHARAMDVIRTERAARAQAPLPAAELYKTPLELTNLNQERESLLQRDIDNLNHELGPEASEKLRALITSTFVQNPQKLAPRVLSHPLRQVPLGVQSVKP